MRMLVVNPPGVAQGNAFDIPTNILYLVAALRRAGVDAGWVDGNICGWDGVQSAIDEAHPEIVGISAMVPVRFSALRVAEGAKGYGARVAMGNHYGNWLWADILTRYTYVDAVAFSEGEETIVELAQTDDWSTVSGIATRTDGIPTRHVGRHCCDMASLPLPAWDEVDWPLYRSMGAFGPRVYCSRGCYGHCKFCEAPEFWNGYRTRPAQSVVDEVEWLRSMGNEHVILGDDTLSLKAARHLFDVLAKRLPEPMGSINVTTRADALDESLCETMRACGVNEVCLGVETGSQRMLDAMGKRTSVERNREAIAMLKRAGIRVKALMLNHAIGETSEDEAETRQFLNECAPDDIGTVDALWLFPGSPWYDEIKAGVHDEKIVSGREWVTDEFWFRPEFEQSALSYRDGVIEPVRVTDR